MDLSRGGGQFLFARKTVAKAKNPDFSPFFAALCIFCAKCGDVENCASKLYKMHNKIVSVQSVQKLKWKVNEIYIQIIMNNSWTNECENRAKCTDFDGKTECLRVLSNRGGKNKLPVCSYFRNKKKIREAACEAIASKCTFWGCENDFSPFFSYYISIDKFLDLW